MTLHQYFLSLIMSGPTMKVQQDSKLLFGGNVITTINNNIKACQQILQEQQQQKPILKEKLSKNT